MTKQKETMLESIQKKEGDLVVNGLFLPEKDKKRDDFVYSSVCYKSATYTNLGLLSKKIDVSMNKIVNALVEKFIDDNKHLLKTKKEQA